MSEISKLNQSFASKKIDNETLNVQIFKNDILMALVGEFNSNLLELEKLTSSIEDPLIAQVASKLKERLNIEEDLDSEQASITRLALCELYRFTEMGK